MNEVNRVSVENNIVSFTTSTGTVVSTRDTFPSDCTSFLLTVMPELSKSSKKIKARIEREAGDLSPADAMKKMSKSGMFTIS